MKTSHTGEQVNEFQGRFCERSRLHESSIDLVIASTLCRPSGASFHKLKDSLTANQRAYPAASAPRPEPVFVGPLCAQSARELRRRAGLRRYAMRGRLHVVRYVPSSRGIERLKVATLALTTLWGRSCNLSQFICQLWSGLGSGAPPLWAGPRH